ncbi:MAG: formate/nitrite transporter family protein [Dehalococcoidia bacterium]
MTVSRKPVEPETPIPSAQLSTADLDAIADEAAPLGRETAEIIEAATEIGRQRLRRPILGEAITALIGGMSVCFGAVAMATTGGLTRDFAGPSAALLTGALSFPIGFVILLIGKSELFTENFLVPVLGVLEGRGTLKNLGRLWMVSLIFNLIGAIIFAWLISRPGVLDSRAAADLRSIGIEKAGYSFGTAFTKAIFAGWLMSILTWLLLACASVGQRLAIIWMVATLIILGGFNHAVISAAESFMAIDLGARLSYAQWFLHNLIPAVLGNMTGGILFVTALFYLQHNALSDERTILGDDAPNSNDA